MQLSEQQERILASMGVTLVCLQVTEKIINLCMTFVFQKRSSLTLEALQRQRTEEQKKTIGYFLAQLRKRVDLDENFDKMLRDFLEYRNTFIHNLDDVQGWDLDTPDGRQVAKQFVSKLSSLNQRVMFTFCGFARAWQKQIGSEGLIAPGSEEFFLEIDRIYAPLIHELVFKKED